MITLSPYDLQLVDRIESGLKKCVGKSKAATSKFMMRKLKEEGYQKISGAKIREMIHYLRTVRKVIIIGDQNGYYMPTSNQDIEMQLRSLKSRIKEISEVYDVMSKTYHSQFKQEEIFG